ncbi:uncharacterized protein LOC114162006 [Xiphophorus couchianus]|uniref:uncharacterized protein LOC114162006 n=1 Tax=Xiphophorus couchianus TaxID=32473 RepID=UPI001016D166|nr:T-cell surface glycoprotein CD3 epsilon chain [Xiphophorus couchianus]
MGVQVMFVVLFMFLATVESQKGGVSFWRDKVTLTCPQNGTWKNNMENKNALEPGETHEFHFKGQAQYYCEYDNNEEEKIKYYFFVKGKACENCFEVDGFLFLLVILVDVIGTAVMMRIIYVCTKRKHPNAPLQPPRTRRTRPQADQSSAYEVGIVRNRLFRMAVQVVFAVIFMFATSVKAETVKGGATFWNKEVTLTCPESDKVTWYKEKSTTPETTENPPNPFTFTYERQVQYKCRYEIDGSPTKTLDYYFYVKGKACKNCFELDPRIFLGIIVVNVIGTAVLMMIIYRCSKKKSIDGPSPSIKPTPRAGHRAPHGPSAEYETLNPNTRSQDTYSTVVNSGMVNRTG